MIGAGERETVDVPELDDGWLVEQLPRSLAEDEFVRRFVAIFEDIAMTVHGRIDGVPHHLDPGLAAPEFVRWVGGWLGAAVHASVPEERQRRLVRQAGPMLAWRGTRVALEGMLEALTGARVEVGDGGGVYPAGQAPPTDLRVTVVLDDDGGIEGEKLRELISGELPVDATLELRIG